ncbi:sensor histidine kinase [Streptomyces sp. S6]
MNRLPLAALVVVAVDSLVLATGFRGPIPLWGAVVGYALAVVAVLAVCRRAPVGGFVTAVTLFALLPGAYLSLLWTAFRAGQALSSRRDTAVTAVAASGGLVLCAALHASAVRELTPLVMTALVFEAIPLMVGRYLTQHERLVAALSDHNRRLHDHQRVLAEHERLRERLRIARDMHDSLGQRLSLVSVQAAALEVSLPPAHRVAVRQLAHSARGALDEVYGLIGTLRGELEPESVQLAEVEELVEEFRAAGVRVGFVQDGEPVALAPATWWAVYRVVQEGLTNAAKHAVGREVAVRVEWQGDSVLVRVESSGPSGEPPYAEPPSAEPPSAERESVRPDARPVRPVVPPLPVRPDGAGHGLVGLGERVRLVGGLLDHGPLREGAGYRVLAMLPATADAGAAALDTAPETAPDMPGSTGPTDTPDAPPAPSTPDTAPPPPAPASYERWSTARTFALTVAVVLLLVVVPGSLLMGAR